MYEESVGLVSVYDAIMNVPGELSWKGKPRAAKPLYVALDVLVQTKSTDGCFVLETVYTYI